MTFEDAYHDHDAQRRELQARNSELVNENRRLRSALIEASANLETAGWHTCAAAARAALRSNP